MRIKIIALSGLIGFVGLCGLPACNNTDSNASSAGSSPDSSSIAAASNTGTNASGTNTTTDSSKKDTTATAANKSAKKHRRASINWPAAGTDAIVHDKDGVYNRAETMPEYPGGQNALAKYVNDNLEYGTYTDDAKNVGKITVSFVVDDKGKVTDVRELGDNKIGGGVDDQVVKTITNMPDWKPGMVKGKKVKTRLQLPIDFQTE